MWTILECIVSQISDKKKEKKMRKNIQHGEEGNQTPTISERSFLVRIFLALIEGFYYYDH